MAHGLETIDADQAAIPFSSLKLDRRIELGLESGYGKGARTVELARVAETLLSISPIEMSEFDEPEALLRRLNDRA